VEGRLVGGKGEGRAVYILKSPTEVLKVLVACIEEGLKMASCRMGSESGLEGILVLQFRDPWDLKGRLVRGLVRGGAGG
jgi:hypothetical protein